MFARVAFALIWLLALALAFEFAVRLRDVLAERDAATYMATMPPPAPGMRRATAAEQEVIREHGFFPTTMTPRQPAPEASQSAANAATPDDPQALAGRFWALYKNDDEDSRNARAALDGEFWALYSEDDTLVTSFGDPDVEFNILGGAVPAHRHDSLALRHLEPGKPLRMTVPTSPIWDYEVARIDTTVPGTAQSLTLLRFHDNVLHASYAEISSRYAEVPGSATLIPQFIQRPNYNDGFTVTDQFGFENYPVVLPKPADVIRIVCIGGSTTHEGAATGFRTTFYLEKLLDGQFPGYKVEVINCGLPGTSSFQMRRHARDYLAYEPDLILYYEGINDLLWLLNARRGELSGWRGLPLQSRALALCFNRALLISDERFAEYWRRSTRRNLLAIRLAAEEHGVPMAAASITYVRRSLLSQREWNFIQFNARTTWGAGCATYGTIAHLLDLHNACLKELCQTARMGYIPFAENFDHGMRHFRDICHFTPEGMQERARILQGWLTPWIQQRIAERGGKA